MEDTTDSSGSWLGDLWDSATGVFKDYLDYDSWKFEQNMAEERWRWEKEQAKANAPAQSSWAPISGSSGGIDNKTLLIGGALIVGGYLVAKQMKLI